MSAGNIIPFWIMILINFTLKRRICKSGGRHYTLRSYKIPEDIRILKSKSNTSLYVADSFNFFINSAENKIIQINTYYLTNSSSNFMPITDQKRSFLLNVVSKGKVNLILEFNRVDESLKIIEMDSTIPEPSSDSGKPFFSEMPDGNLVLSYVAKDLNTLVLVDYHLFFQTIQLLKTFTEFPNSGGENSVFQCNYSVKLNIFLCLVSKYKVDNYAYIYGLTRKYEIIQDPFFPIKIGGDNKVFHSNFCRINNDLTILTIKFSTSVVKMYGIKINVSDYKDITIQELETTSFVKNELVYPINEKYFAYTGVYGYKRMFGFFFFSSSYEKNNRHLLWYWNCN